MRSELHPKLIAGRVRTGLLASDDSYGLNGKFYVSGPNSAKLMIIASDANASGSIEEHQGWEHVSISLPNRCPNWPEMCFVKDLFWDPEETVVQFHPPKSEHISNHDYCLHLFRDTRNGHALPPSIMVGRQDLPNITRDPWTAIALTRRRLYRP